MFYVYALFKVYNWVLIQSWLPVPSTKENWLPMGSRRDYLLLLCNETAINNFSHWCALVLNYNHLTNTSASEPILLCRDGCIQIRFEHSIATIIIIFTAGEMLSVILSYCYSKKYHWATLAKITSIRIFGLLSMNTLPPPPPPPPPLPNTQKK